MIKTELVNLGIDVDELVTKLTKLNTEIGNAAKSYANTKIGAEKELKGLRAKLVGVHSSSNGGNVEGSETLPERISKFVFVQTSWMGVKKSAEAAASASRHVARQTKKHSVAGTLALSVSCTHKNAQVLAPFVLDVDKGIKAWNSLFSDDRLDPTSQKGMMDMAKEDDKEDEKKYSIISGMTIGSNFIGMVHVLKTTETTSSQDMTTMAASLQAYMNTGSWFASASGGFGVDASMANDVKNLLSSQNITSHVTLICMGVIPSMVANDVKIGVEKFATNDPKANIETLATLQNAASAEQDSIKQSAAAARTGQQMISMKAGEVKAALSALAEIDDGANKILDINSMMRAFDDYLEKAADGNSCVPINYYLKDITKSMLAEM